MDDHSSVEVDAAFSCNVKEYSIVPGWYCTVDNSFIQLQLLYTKCLLYILIKKKLNHKNNMEKDHHACNYV